MRFFLFYVYLESYLLMKRPIHFAQAFVFSLVMTALLGQTLDALVFQKLQNIFGIVFAIQYFCFLILLQSQIRAEAAVSKLLLMRAPSIATLFFAKIFVLWWLMSLLVLFFLPVFQVMLFSVQISFIQMAQFFLLLVCGNVTLSALGIIMSALVMHHRRASVMLSISILPLFLPILLFMVHLLPHIYETGGLIFGLGLGFGLDFLVFFLITSIYLLLTMQLYGYLLHEA